MVWTCRNGDINLNDSLTNCQYCGSPRQQAQSPSPQPTPQDKKREAERYKKRKGGFFSKLGSLGSWFKKWQREKGKKVEEGKEKAVVGARYAYQRPLTVASRRLAQASWWIKPFFIAIIVIIIAGILLGFNVVQFGYLSTFGGLAFIISGVILIFFGLSELSKTHNIGYLYLIGGLILSLVGLYIYGLFSTVYLYVAIAIVVLYILVKSKLSSKNKFLILVGLAVLGLLLFYFGNISTVAVKLLSLNVFNWVIALLLIVCGLWLISKKDSKGKHSYALLGVILVLIPLVLYFLTSYAGLNLSNIASIGGLSLKWVIIGFLVVLIIASLAKGQYTWAILFFVVIILVWFFSSESGSLILSNLGVKAQVSGGETLSARLGKYLDYIKNPESFFARYGEFGNPNIENKALVGLKIDKFEPLIKEYRANQDLRFTAEVKHYGLPVFKEDNKNNRLKLGFLCYISKESGDASRVNSYVGDVVVRPGQPIASTTGNSNGNLPATELKETMFEEPLKFKNFTKFVSCTFKGGVVPANLDKETRKVYLNVSYRDFVTRSDIYAYLIGQNAYSKIENGVLEAGGDSDIEFLYQLRSAASYPGLIDNERRTISEFSSGPVWLQVNILDQQPLYPGRSYPYTLRVKSMPNSVDWTNAINVKNIYLEVPTWFTPTQDCDFTDTTSGSSTMSTNKRLILKSKLLEERKSSCAGGGASCGFVCSFNINNINAENVQEYRISAYQTTDYTLTQGTSFDYVKIKSGTVSDAEKENENAKNDPAGLMNKLLSSTKKSDIERYLKICKDGTDSILRLETINILKIYCKIEDAQEKLDQLNAVSPGGATTPPSSGGTTPAPTTQPAVESLKINAAFVENVINSDINGNIKLDLKAFTSKEAKCAYSRIENGDFTQELSVDLSKREHSADNQNIPRTNELFVKCTNLDGSEPVIRKVTISNV